MVPWKSGLAWMLLCQAVPNNLNPHDIEDIVALSKCIRAAEYSKLDEEKCPACAYLKSELAVSKV
jgi:Na+-translocating ferredoxin:NAD+ oxidoreductase RnfC subunit